MFTFLKSLRTFAITLLLSSSIVTAAHAQQMPEGDASGYTPTVAAGQYGSVSEFWQFACTSGFNTNIFDVIEDVIAQLGDMQGLITDLSVLLDLNFQEPDISRCLPNGVQFPNLQFPGVSGLLQCFSALPNLTGIFGNMANCVGGILGNFPQLGGFLGSLNLGNVINCLYNQLPDLPTFNVPDLLGNLLDKIGAVLDLLGNIRVDLPKWRQLINWMLEICQTIQTGGNGGFPMSGATYGTTFNQTATSGFTAGFSYNPPSAPAAAMLGAGMEAAQVSNGIRSAFVMITSERKIADSDVEVDAEGLPKKIKLMKSMKMKRSSAQSFKGTVKFSKLKLPCGEKYRYTLLAQMQSGAQVPVGGGRFKVPPCNLGFKPAR